MEKSELTLTTGGRMRSSDKMAEIRSNNNIIAMKSLIHCDSFAGCSMDRIGSKAADSTLVDGADRDISVRKSSFSQIPSISSPFASVNLPLPDL